MDTTNPGLVNVADQAFNPDLRVNSLGIPKDDDTLVSIAKQGTPRAKNDPVSEALPKNDDTLIDVAGQGEPRAENDVTSTVVPVPAESIIAAQAAVPISQDFGETPGVAPSFLPFPPSPLDPDIAEQDLTAGSIADFTVAGPDISIQTNQSAETAKDYKVMSILDADTRLPPTSLTTRYRLTVNPHDLTSLEVSMQGRPIVFDNAILTANNEGASRIITGYGANFIVIDKYDDNDQIVPILDNPHPGDTFTLNVQRQGSEVVSRDTGTTTNVTISPPPLVDVPTGISNENFQGTTEVSTGPQPGEPVITSGEKAPTAINVNVSDQDAVIGLPVNVFP